jgi:ureidoacrylate peracid hydrolase
LLDAADNPIVAAGSWGAEPFLVTEAPEDRVIVKHRYSAFVGTSLELSLRAKRRDVFLVAGVATDICVHATAVHGLMNGFLPVLLTDCAAGTTEERHSDAVETFLLSMGPVVDSATVRDVWTGQSTGDGAKSEPAPTRATQLAT